MREDDDWMTEEVCLGSFGRGLSSVFGGSKKKDKESPAEKGTKDDGR